MCLVSLFLFYGIALTIDKDFQYKQSGRIYYWTLCISRLVLIFLAASFLFAGPILLVMMFLCLRSQPSEAYKAV